jgi:hypothetical protein
MTVAVGIVLGLALALIAAASLSSSLPKRINKVVPAPAGPDRLCPHRVAWFKTCQFQVTPEINRDLIVKGFSF